MSDEQNQNTKTIRERIIKIEKFPWSKFKFIQPQDFKEMSVDGYARLKKSIIKRGFSESFKAWEHNGEVFCLDGFGRVKVLEDLAKWGYDVPESFTTEFVDCRDRKEAAEFVLMYSAIYRRLYEDSLYQFIIEEDLSWPDIEASMEFPAIDMDEFGAGYFEDDMNGGGGDDESASSKKEKKCPNCGFEL